VCEVDLQPGGIWRYCMTGPNGEQAWGKAIYDEIVAPERLAYTDSFADADGNVNPDLPTMRVTVNFFDEGKGRTTKIVSHTLYASAAELQKVLDMGMAEGVRETWDYLDEMLSKV